MDRACHPQDAAVASSVTSKVRTSDRDLIAVTAHESGTLCQGQVPPVLSGGGRLGRETGAPVTSSLRLNCAWIDSPIFYKEPLYLLPVDANAAFPDSDRWQLTALNQVVHSRPGNPEICCCFGNPIHGFSVSTRRSSVSTFVSSGTLLINCAVDLTTKGGGGQSPKTRGFAGVSGDFPRASGYVRRDGLCRLERVYSVDEAATELEVGIVYLFFFVCRHAT
jgi:hypothetical protein